MKIKGICYDVGTRYSAGFDTSRNLTDRDIRKELLIIKNSLKCNAIRLYGSDVNKLLHVTDISLRLHINTWVSPRFINFNEKEIKKTLLRLLPQIEILRKKSKHTNPVFFVGNELSLDSTIIFKSKTYEKRAYKVIHYIKNKKPKNFDKKLNNSLHRLVEITRSIFKGPISYACPSWEKINWDKFDIIGLNRYINQKRYKNFIRDVSSLRKYDKPIIVSEFGCSTFKNASVYGGFAWLFSLYSFIRRSEDEQARSIEEQIKIINRTVDGGFIFTFVEPKCGKLDALSYGIMRYIKNNSLKPKKAFSTVKKYYGMFGT